MSVKLSVKSGDLNLFGHSVGKVSKVLPQSLSGSVLNSSFFLHLSFVKDVIKRISVSDL